MQICSWRIKQQGRAAATDAWPGPDVWALSCSFNCSTIANHPLFPAPSFARAEVLGALLSTLTIWAVTGILVYEAIQRIIHPEDVDGRRETRVTLRANLTMLCSKL